MIGIIFVIDTIPSQPTPRKCRFTVHPTKIVRQMRFISCKMAQLRSICDGEGHRPLECLSSIKFRDLWIDANMGITLVDRVIEFKQEEDVSRRYR